MDAAPAPLGFRARAAPLAAAIYPAAPGARGPERPIRNPPPSAWTGTAPTNLGTLGGTNSYGFGINSSGQVAGSSQILGSSTLHAVLWIGTTPADLGAPGGYESSAAGINDSGDVAGIYYFYGNHAFLYTEGVMYDLSSLLVSGSGITGLDLRAEGNNINNLGQIAAQGFINGGTTYHALLLTPTPEPTSAMLMIGFGLMLLLRRRRGAAR